MRMEMRFFDHSFAHIFFVFYFVAKPKLEFREINYVLSNYFKIQQLQFSLEEKSSFFCGTGSGDRLFSDLVP